MRAPRTVLPSISAGVGMALSAALLRRGVVMGPDSWAYWEGSVSLLEQGHYRYLGGAPILAFPPLFPAVLALVQAGLGVSMRTLAIALVVLVGLASYAWTALYASVPSDRRSSAADALAVLLIPATLAVSGQTLLSEALWLALLPIPVLLLLEGPDDRERSRMIRVALLVGALLLTRNATVAMLPAVAWLAWRRRPDAPGLRRLGMTLAVVAVPLPPWLAVRAGLGQGAAHAFGRGAHGPVEYALQAIGGLAYGLGPTRAWIGAALLGLVGVALARDAADRTRTAAPLAAFALLGLLGHAALFSVTFVAEPLRGRFVVFAVLALGVAVLALAARERAVLVLAAALTTVALYRAGIKVRLAGIEQPTVALDVRIASGYATGPPRTEPGGVLVAPPTYPWIPHR